MNLTTERIVDEYLVLRCQNHEHAALDILVAKWQGPFVKYAAIVTRDPDLAADIVQDAWIKIIKGLPSLRDAGLFQAWAYRIVNNRCTDMLRKPQVRGADALPEDVRVNPFRQLEDRDEVQVLLARLGDKHRSVLALHYLQGFDVAEIAKITSTAEGTVKSRLFTGREKFRELLERTQPTTRATTGQQHAQSKSGDRHGQTGRTNSGGAGECLPAT